MPASSFKHALIFKLSQEVVTITVPHSREASQARGGQHGYRSTASVRCQEVGGAKRVSPVGLRTARVAEAEAAVLQNEASLSFLKSAATCLSQLSHQCVLYRLLHSGPFVNAGGPLRSPHQREAAAAGWISLDLHRLQSQLPVDP